jgi:sugar phosphate isomerase/epimerase
MYLKTPSNDISDRSTPTGEVPGSKPWNASLSTMWASKNFQNLGDFFAAAKRIGFAKIELNHQINSTMLADQDMSQVQVSSIHEPCPADISVDTLKDKDWLVSAQDEEKRRVGVDAIRRSIELAHKLNAGTVVVHAGNVLTNNSLEKKLRTLFEAGRKQTREYRDLMTELQQARRSQARFHLDAVKKSLVELLKFARPYGIRLGIENRYHFGDIPSLDEMDLLLELAGTDQLGFVYDVGHAQALDQLGFFPHLEWLERFSSCMIGAHFHDVIGVNDHFAPGMGEVNFKRIAAFIPSDAFRTLELKPKVTSEQITAGMYYLIRCGCIGYLE